MKKLGLLMLMAIAFMFASCNKSSDDGGNGSGNGGGNGVTTYCWKFTVTMKCTGMDTVTSTSTQCNLTEKQAEDVRISLESTSSSGGVTCKTTATKKRQ